MNEITAVLVEAAGRIFAEANPKPPAGFDAPLWKLIEESGLERLLLPEDKGGSGDAFADAAALAGLVGSHAPSVPLIETLAANWCLAKAGLDVPDGPKALVVSADGENPVLGAGQLTGLAGLSVPWEPVASARVMLARRAGEPMVALVTDPLPGEARETLAGEPLRFISDSTAKVRVVASGPWLGHPDAPLALLAVLKAAAIAGAAEAAVGLSIEYANLRVQFGRKIGAFQAIQHMIAKMASEAAAAGAAAQYASRQFAEPDGIFAAAAAKGRASEAAGKIAAGAQQVHGAIGFTAEHALHRFTRRLWSWRDEAGNERYWYGRVGQTVFRSHAGELWTGLADGLKL